MNVVRVDPRDQAWEIGRPRYRAYFRKPGGLSLEYELSGADSVIEVLEWAEAERGLCDFTLYVCVPGDGLGLVQLAGSTPRSDEFPR